MPYTLAMFFFWGLLMALVGVVIGWLLRSLQQRIRDGRPGAPTDARPDRPRSSARPVHADGDRDLSLPPETP